MGFILKFQYFRLRFVQDDSKFFFFLCYHDFLRKTVDNAEKKDYNQDNLTVTHVVRTRYAKVVSQRAADGAIVADEIASLPPSPVIRLLVRNK